MRLFPGYSRLRWQQLIHSLIPTYCLLCNARLGKALLCHDCEMDLPYLTRCAHYCQQCALPLTTDSNFCGHCLHQPPGFNRAFIPFLYAHPLDYLIRTFKYRRNQASGKALTRLLVPFLNTAYEETGCTLPDYIIPVPLHWRRRLVRGFNQTALLAAELQQSLAVEILENACRRQGYTPAQQGLNRRQRQKNLRNVFSLNVSAKRKIEGRCVAILDDVVTTTATARELSRLLLRQGAREVHLWALARTPQDR